MSRAARHEAAEQDHPRFFDMLAELGAWNDSFAP
jgi:hypothetical protein